MKLTAFVLVALQSLSAHAALFGADNRHVVDESSPVWFLSRSTAVAVLSTNMTVNKNGTFDLDTNPIKDFCPDERFAAGPSLEYACTGFLIAPDLLVTAGHCVYAVNAPSHDDTLQHESELACKSFSWLFDYQSHGSAPAQTKGIDASRLYKCKEIIFAKQTEKAPFVDYALIRLDRPATGRTPFKIAPAPVKVGDGLAMIGYPFGTPAKYSDNARVTLNNPGRASFLTSLDASEGNSGAPVFNAQREVVGILIGGTPSANTYTPKNMTCERVNRCTEDGSRCYAVDSADFQAKIPGFQGIGSEVQRIQAIKDLLK